jgi:acyl-CoA synthetase (AMP-forming)/AMP-acid ligase II
LCDAVFSACVSFTFNTRYWDDDEQTRKVMKKDEDDTLWMWTGDEGIMDEEGYLKSKFS